MLYTVQVTDTRGRTASATTEFYVNAYNAPSIGPVYVQRCDANGNPSQSGTYAIYTINSSYSSIGGKNTRTITAAYSSNNGSTYSAETTIQASTDTASTKTGVYGGGAFAVASTYMIRFTIKDVYGATNTIVVPLRAAERPMNVRSNGKGIAFGKMAETDNFLDCAWNIKSHGWIETSEYSKLTGFSYVGIADLNTMKIPGMYGVYNSTNAPTSDIATLEVVMYSPDWIIQRFTSVGSGTEYVRSWYGATTWSPWVRVLDESRVKDYVVEQGMSGGWTYRKWYSGLMEVIGTVSHNPTAVNDGVNSVQVTLPVSFIHSAFTVMITPAKCGLLVSACGDCNSANGIEHTNNSFVLSYKYNHGQVYTVNFNVTVSGRWA